MAEFRIVLVEPEYPVNLGHCARVLANFGCSEMNLVNPKVRGGRTAVMYAKGGRELLSKAKVYGSIREAASGCDFIVGTSGIVKRGRGTVRNPLTLEQFVRRAERTGKRFAILFGREGTGLSAKEIASCDLLVSIPADKGYPVLNLSHALAIVLYCLSKSRGHKLIKNAERGEKEELVETFSGITDFYGPRLRNPEKIKMAFRRIVGRSLVSDLEAKALLCVMKKAKEEIGRKRTPSA
jgi:tRNA/rRNA methyltransferase